MRFAYSTLSIAVLTALNSAVFAENPDKPEQVKSEASIKLSTIVVEAKAENEVGKTVYNKEDLQKTPNSSKNITDFLKINPNVQFSQAQFAAAKQGEIKPAEISINGAQTFQNNFIINGISNNLLINPADSDSNTYQGFGTGSQAMALNTDLLCELEVLDSNVSASYGQFTGGVINAKTCAPNTEIGKLHGSINYDYTENNWARYNAISPKEEELFEEPSEAHQKEYTKQGLSTNIYGKLSEKWGFNSYASQRSSIIPVLSGFESPRKIDQERNNTNLGSTFFYNPTDTIQAKFGFDYGLLDSLSYTEGRQHSDSIIQTKTKTLFSELEHRVGSTTLIHKLAYQNSDSSRESSKNYGLIWHHAEGSKDWTNSSTVSEGTTLGNLEQNQAAVTYGLTAIFDHFNIGTTQHQVTVGTGYNHAKVDWNRSSNVYISNSTASNLKNLGSASCLVDDPFCDEKTTLQGWTGQYFANASIYKGGTFSAQQDNFHLFAEDKIQWNNMTARLGLRADYDSLSSNLNIAPRSSISYRPFSNEKLQLLAGWNRYYGQQTLGTELNDGIGELMYKMTRQHPQAPWIETPSLNSSSTRRSELDTPFSDETVLGVNGQIQNWDLGLKWVNRKYRDEISRTRTDIPRDGFKYSYEYSNAGKGEADIYTFTMKNHQPLQLGNSHHFIALGFDYSDIFRSYTDYSDEYNPANQDRLVSYGGKIIHWADRPAPNFNQPWTARINWDIGFASTPLKISNFFSYKDSYNDMILNGKTEYNDQKIDVYQASEIRPKFTWDTRTTYDWKVSKELNAIFGLTINNVTNRVNTYVTGASTSSSTPRVMTEIGRQFIADVTFKF
ncbi:MULTISPECIES: TonB-dependent siderophore receptor [unclassified Acinetobacter]|uniref:TonB-dependent receptor plug domain-containing protein n=1 Tax=unclassified Acinetobacter TaxID=196816 RepID=UPI001C2145EC|nr:MULTISPECIES: TonB-dependent receptor plug domain-containing protein [unclassified Acinetobacter]